MPDINYESVLTNEKCPAQVRYAIIRQAVNEKVKSRQEKRDILFKVGHFLGGAHKKGTPNYWEFSNGKKAKFI